MHVKLDVVVPAELVVSDVVGATVEEVVVGAVVEVVGELEVVLGELEVVAVVVVAV